jgi:peptide-methionine (R)-S-oxide reductase
MNRKNVLAAMAAVAGLAVVGRAGRAGAAVSGGSYAVVYTDVEWRKRLSPAAYDVLRNAGTEYPGTSPLLNEHRAGTFACAGCNLALFDSKTKFDSGTGWPSFYAPLPKAVLTKSDTELGYERTEVHCSQCGGHLGHVFDDGPKPTGLRYCMNGVALQFHPKAASAAS